MALPITSYSEKVGDTSPSTAGFALQGGKCRRTWQLINGIGSGAGGAITASDVQGAVTTIIGNTNTAVGNYKLNRTLPMEDPQFNWMYATNISTIRGLGQNTLTASTPNPEAGPGQIFPNFALYANYEFDVEFAPLPFAVIPDQNITIGFNQWFNFAGNARQYAFAREFNRYLDIDVQPSPQNITAQQGRH